jgi:uncharacterized membrane protein YfcA
MITDPTFYAVAAIAVCCLGLSKGGFIGFGLIATPLLALVIPPLQSAGILGTCCWTSQRDGAAAQVQC